MDERVSIDFDGLWLAQSWVLITAPDDVHIFYAIADYLYVLNSTWNRSRNTGLLLPGWCFNSECKYIIPFFNVSEFSVISCTVTQILHLPSLQNQARGDWTGEVRRNAHGQKRKEITVHMKITSVTTQAWVKITHIRLQQKTVFIAVHWIPNLPYCGKRQDCKHYKELSDQE